MRNRVGAARHTLDGARRIRRLTITTVLVLVTWLSFEARRRGYQHGSQFVTAPDQARYLDEVSEIFEDEHNHDHDHDHSHDHGEEEHEEHDEAVGHNDNHLALGDTPWLEGILAALAINLATLFAVIIVSLSASVLHFKTKCCSLETVLGIVLPALAMGTLMATSVFLILPEALHLLEQKETDSYDGHDHRRFLVVDGRRYLEVEGHEGHSDGWAAWRFGTAILGGFILPFFVASFFPKRAEWVEDPLWSQAIGLEDHVFEAIQKMEARKRKRNQASESEEQTSNPHQHHSGLPSMKLEHMNGPARSGGVSDPPPANVSLPMGDESSGLDEDNVEINWKLAWTVLAGDFIHNFVDGILVGNSFLLCDRRTSVVVCVATFLHEIPQELVDFALLTNQCHFKVGTALEANFLSGVSILFGVVVILGIKDIASSSTGAILAVSAGVYIYLGCVEIFPPVLKITTTFGKRMLAVLAFTLGAIPIGLVLLNHVHCEEG